MMKVHKLKTLLCVAILLETALCFLASESLTVSPRQSKSLHDEHERYRPKITISDKELERSFTFASGSVERLRRLESNLGRSQVNVKNGTPANYLLLENNPKYEALEENVKALIAAKAVTHLMSSYCHKHKLTTHNCAKQFTKVPISSFYEKDICKPLKKCSSETKVSSYRSFDGSCNHLTRSDAGQSFTTYRRLVFPDYMDGVQEPRRSRNRKHKLPSPRNVHSALIQSDGFEDDKRTLAVMQWGEFISHDLYQTVVSKMIHTGSSIECCTSKGEKFAPRYQHPFCSSIDIAANDKFYSKYGLQCMTYVRSVIGARSDCNLGPIEQLNQVTHFLDGSQIYGSTEDVARSLRSFESGSLHTPFEYQNNGLFDENNTLTDKGVVSGDPRATFQPDLTAMYLIWTREHNRVAKHLTNLNPAWTDEKLYQEARKIVIGELQHISYKEWLPKILGDKYLNKVYSATYDRNVDPSITNSFATAAFRFVYSMMASNISMFSEGRVVNKSIRLSDHFYKPLIINDEGILDSLLIGLATQKSQAADTCFVEDVSNLLYGNGKIGFDVVSLDIQRGRDHGIPGYTKFRKLFGKPFKSFLDFEDSIRKKDIKKLEQIYKDPSDVDLIIGGLLEQNDEDSLLGSIFSKIIADQFFRTKSGDRYFYTFDNFTPMQLHQIEKSSLARIFCDNSDNIKTMQRDVFQIINEKNRLQDCDDPTIPRMDLNQWKE